jgi:hypothetical protein
MMDGEYIDAESNQSSQLNKSVMRVFKIYFQYLRNEAHCQYFSIVKDMLAEDTAVAAIVADYLKEFNELFDIEISLVDAMKTSEYTRKIAEIRKRVDRDLVGINNAVDAALHHYDPEMVKAAKSLRLRIKPFTGRAGKKAYEESAGGISILLDDLKESYQQQITTLGLDGWVEELAEAHTTFEQLLSMRNNELAARPKYKLTVIRKQIEAVYRKMIELIDAHSIANDSESCRQFVLRLNAEIGYFNNSYRYKAIIDVKKFVVSPIPIQTIDDDRHPVTPIPEVFYLNKKLVFTVDYELSYSNNDKPGTATVFIRGKSAYKGVIAISFNIQNKTEHQ